MFGIALLSFSGALSLSYYCLSGLDVAPHRPAEAEPPVYDAKAVPRDVEPVQSKRSRTGGEQVNSAPNDRAPKPARDSFTSRKGASAGAANTSGAQGYDFPNLDTNLRAQNYSLATSVGRSGDSVRAAGEFAPDDAFGEVAPVPESAGWSFIGLGCVALVTIERCIRTRQRP
ncbi:MAG: hypothetical protein ACJ8KU_07625 [Chthoniobacterales bacterium]